MGLNFFFWKNKVMYKDVSHMLNTNPVSFLLQLLDWTKGLRITSTLKSTKLQDVRPKWEEENVQTLTLKQGGRYFPCGENDALLKERNIQVPDRCWSTSLHGSRHRVPSR